MKKVFLFKTACALALIASTAQLLGAAPALDTDTWLKAARTGDIAPIQEYLDQRDMPVDTQNSFGSTALMLAAQNGHHDIVELLLKRGANTDTQDNNGITALMLAVDLGHHDIVDLLLKQKANVNKRNSGGISALDVAIRNNNPEMVEYLLGHGARGSLITRQLLPNASQEVKEAFMMIAGSINP